MTTDAVAMDPELAKRVLTALRAQDEPAGEDAGELRRPGGGRAVAPGGGAALEAAEAARGPVAAAQAMVAEAEEAYRATTAPEEQAAATYARARHEAGVR